MAKLGCSWCSRRFCSSERYDSRKKMMGDDRKSPVLTVDGVLVLEGRVLLIKRTIEPFVGKWVLPGGHVEYGEKVEDALRREVLEETGLKAREIELIGVYSDPDRDPRYHTVSCAYFVEMDGGGKVSLNREADEYKFFDFNNLPEEMGFDHRKILSDVKERFSFD